MAAIGNQLKKRLQDLKSRRTTFDSILDDCAFYCLPSDEQIYLPRSQETDPGDKTPVTNVGIECARVLAGGMYANTFSLADPWFTLQAADPVINESEAAKRWLADAGKMLLNALNNSNLPEVLHECLHRLSVMHTDVVSIEYRNGLQFRSHSLTNCWLSEAADGSVDTVFRQFGFTAKQAAEKWGEENLPDDVRKDAQRGDRQENVHQFVHAVFPRTGRDMRRNSRLKRDLKDWASIYFHEGSGTIVEEGGYDSFPFAVPRFMKVKDTPYGGGPAQDALPALRALNRMFKDFIDASEVATFPPVFLPFGTEAQQVDLRPGAVNHALSPNGGQPYFAEVRTNFQALLESINQHTEQVRNIFYANLFMALTQMGSTSRMTTREVDERVDEKIQLLMPIVNRLQTELYKVIVIRSLSLLIENGDIPTPPAEMLQAAGSRGALDLSVVYQSRLVSRLRDIESQRIAEALQISIAIDQGASQSPVVSALYDLEAVHREIAANKGLPPKMTRSQKDFITVMKARQDAQAAAAAAEQTAGAIKPVDLQKRSEAGSPLNSQG